MEIFSPPMRKALGGISPPTGNFVGGKICTIFFIKFLSCLKTQQNSAVNFPRVEILVLNLVVLKDTQKFFSLRGTDMKQQSYIWRIRDTSPLLFLKKKFRELINAQSQFFKKFFSELSRTL